MTESRPNCAGTFGSVRTIAIVHGKARRPAAVAAQGRPVPFATQRGPTNCRLSRRICA